MKATETTVLNFIGGLDKVFIIPPFQRNYEWGLEQCEELFNDVVDSYKKDKTHYLGNVVYYKGKNDGASYSEFVLVDGQQRVTTILILLCALRDSFDANDNQVKSINNRYLLNDTGDNRFRVRLKQTSYDTNSFMSIIDGSNVENKENNVVRNYEHFLKLIKSCQISTIDLYNTIPKLEVVDVNLQIENDLGAVQTIFEKINSTGKRLTAADLIRNYLLLSQNTVEQERLYEDYWVKIEQMVENKNVSKFAKDYLILNIFEDVQEAKTYKMFKEHFNSNEALRIDILRDMHRYSRYFNWIKFEKCPNVKINNIVKYLNYIKTEDVYPLYLYLFDTLYEECPKELEKILKLICDFMIRYRIVSPSGGGGALRSVVQQLLENLNSGATENTFDGIYFELSNSSSPSGRFPDNEEFKNTLMNNVSTNYAKTVLLRIEEHETKNEPTDLNKVTIEHIMPQTLSKWWIDNLGGTELSDKIQDQYLNCIGNLTPISQGYNSKISNKPWSDKVTEFKSIQFKITTELCSHSNWSESDIKLRNVDLATRACSAVISPLQRTRKYQTKSVTSDFIDGVYPISDLSTPMSGTTPECIIYNEKEYKVDTWKDFLCIICSLAHRFEPSIFDEIVANNAIHKSTSKKNYPDKDPIITNNPQLIGDAKIIVDSEYFCEGCISSDRARVYAKQILDIFGITDKFQLSVRKK